MWIGTADGLNRYDGYDFRIYRSEPDDSTSLSNSVVRALLQDRTGALWVGTEGGLQRMDQRMEAFHSYSLPWSRPQKTPHTVNDLAFTGRDGTFYFGGMNGLTIFKPEEIAENPIVRPVVINHIQAAGRYETVSINPIQLDRLYVSYRDYSLAFEFAARNFQRPARRREATASRSAWILRVPPSRLTSPPGRCGRRLSRRSC